MDLTGKYIDSVYGVSDDIRAMEMDISEYEKSLKHYGMPRRSGRYPWGSGENPYQHSRDFLSRVEELKKEGKTEAQIAKEIGISSTQLRVQVSLANDERRQTLVKTAEELRAKGYSLNQIAEKMGYKNDSSVRSLLNEKSKRNMLASKATADVLKELTKDNKMIEVGENANLYLNVSQEKMNQALYLLEREGYNVYSARVPQRTNPNKYTTVTVLCPPGMEYGYFRSHLGEVSGVENFEKYVTHDGGETFDKYVYPKSMDSSRLAIRYAEDGGKNKDGVIEIRRGVEDLSLGNSHYAQVRILVDDTKYLKGMAIYSDDLPDGVDVLFNTNKTKDKSKLEVLKDVSKNLENDPENPFGSLIKAGGQSYYIDKDGNRQLSLINKRAEEGDWNDWDDKLPSQFLAKQPMKLINRQLDLSIADKNAEFEEISSLQNPTVKRYFLNKFADACDSDAVYLKAASMPGLRYQVILPINDIKDNEIYAPNYPNGETVYLVRYPHAGTFEIPKLKVNNNNPEGKRIFGQMQDAVGINSKVAEKLSGADFDGDTVMVIPSRGKNDIISKDSLAGLKNFDPKAEYPKRDGMRFMQYKRPDGKVVDNTQKEMGIISNLITDMTIQGATDDELTRAVKHSMVVIDAAKHELDYKKSEIDNDIASLKKRYQRHIEEDGTVKYGGASTLLSKAKSTEYTDKVVGQPRVNRKGTSWYDPSRPEGALIYKYEKETYTDKNGKVKERKSSTTKMAATDDARTLSSGYPQEEAYANYANKLKAMANRARLDAMDTGNLKYSPEARKEYQKEYDSLSARLNIAEKNSPRERLAQMKADGIISLKMKSAKEDGRTIPKSVLKKMNQQALTAARKQVGADGKGSRITLSEQDWKAIQAGAITDSMLKRIMRYADVDSLRALAMPKEMKTKITTGKLQRIKNMSASGYTNAEIADALGISVSTVVSQLKSA